jgi:1,4-alpha-glucan branching enzyme
VGALPHRRLQESSLFAKDDVFLSSFFTGSGAGRPQSCCKFGPFSEVIAMRRILTWILECIAVSAWAQDTSPSTDTEPPTVAIVSAMDGYRVGGHVTLAASATDNIGVATVSFYKNDVLVETDDAAPYSVEVDFTADPPDKDYILKAKAKDSAGNESVASVRANKPGHAFRGIGATPADNGTFFKVWAPHAQKVAVEGDFNDWDRFKHYLWNLNGWWFGFQPGATTGQMYKFVINDALYKPDPYCRQMEHSAGASIIKDPSTFHWTDGAWKTPKFEDMIIYELHVGTFAGKNDGQSYPGNFKNLLSKLDYIKSTGANMIEILPVHEVPGPDSEGTPYLGYSPTGLFAVESAYGTTSDGAYDELKAFVNAAHRKGLGIILDVVYNHFSTDNGRDNWFWNYDGEAEGGDGGIYFNNQNTPWGIAPDWARKEARDYIEDNAKYWLSEFHVDGLRWDFTNEIKNKPNGWEAMRTIVWNLRNSFPERIMICENLPYEKEVVESGNFHSGWWVDFHHKIQAAFQAAGNANLGDAKAGINGGDYSHPTKRVIYAMSHDEARNGGSYLVSEFGGRGSWDARAKARAAAALMLMSPGIPMFFQGEEFAQDGWFNDKRDQAVNWSYEHDFEGSKMLKLYQDATSVRWHHNTLRNGSLTWTHEDDTNKVLAFRRDWGDQSILVVVNFGANSFGGHDCGVSTGGKRGQWTQILCSQDSAYGGWDGAGNAFHEPWTQDDGKIYVNLPKYSVVAMRLN